MSDNPVTKGEDLPFKFLRASMISAAVCATEYVEWQSLPSDSSFSHPATYAFAILAVAAFTTFLVTLFRAGAQK